MRHKDVVIIGAGQAGLAMSRCLSDRGIGHIVLERGQVAERWRTARWDSLRLLTPNWQSRLPGFHYDGPDPDGFMSMGEVVHYLERYAESFNAPVESGTRVTRVVATDGGFRITSDRGEWSARAVVIATGYCDLPRVPALASQIPGDILQVTPDAYRNPSALPPGGVLVAGASASGIQIAHELRQSGRAVTIAAGTHTRMPRMYRGRDIMWWLDKSGMLDETDEHVYDVTISREQPSLQLIGTATRGTLNLAILKRLGVRVTGRMTAVDGGRVSFADDLVATTVAADVKLAALLSRLDAFAEHTRIEAGEPEPFGPIWPEFTDAPTALDLRGENIKTIVWATGFRRNYAWLQVPVLDTRGEIRHRGGITPAAGLYVIGLYFLRRRKSNFIDGVGADAEALAGHVAMHLRGEEAA